MWYPLITELARGHHLLQPHQRLVEDVVLHDAELAVVGRAASTMRWAPAKSLHIGFWRLTCQPLPRSSTTPSSCRGMGSRASTASTSRSLAASSARRRRSARLASRLPLRPALFARVDQRDNLDVRVVQIGTHVEVVDPPEAHECGPYGSFVGCEAHGREVTSSGRRRPSGLDGVSERCSGTPHTSAWICRPCRGPLPNAGCVGCPLEPGNGAVRQDPRGDVDPRARAWRADHRALARRRSSSPTWRQVHGGAPRHSAWSLLPRTSTPAMWRCNRRGPDRGGVDPQRRCG